MTTEQIIANKILMIRIKEWCIENKDKHPELQVRFVGDEIFFKDKNAFLFVLKQIS